MRRRSRPSATISIPAAGSPSSEKPPLRARHRRVHGHRHASVVTNGTVSLFVALAALDIGTGDEVIVPAFSMIASANAVLLAGATPVFVDIDPQTLSLDIEATEAAITTRTKAVMLVSLNGRAPDMDRMMAMCARHGVAVVEDSAQSLGSRRHGRHLGTFGRIGSFSFSAPKIITTGQGGALVTDDDDLIGRIHQLRDFGRARSGSTSMSRSGSTSSSPTFRPWSGSPKCRSSTGVSSGRRRSSLGIRPRFETCPTFNSCRQT